jgi:hypothetical protein
MLEDTMDKQMLIDAGRINYRHVKGTKTYRLPKGTAPYRVRLGTKLIDSFLTTKNMKKQYPGIKAY